MLPLLNIKQPPGPRPQPPTTALKISGLDLVRAAKDDDGVRSVQVAAVVLPLPRHRRKLRPCPAKN